MPRFLDTNILLRYLTRDDEEKAQACLALPLRIERGEEVVVTSDLVIAETVFTLQSPRQYGLSRDRIRQLVKPIVGLRGLRLPAKPSMPGPSTCIARRGSASPTPTTPPSWKAGALIRNAFVSF